MNLFRSLQKLPPPGVSQSPTVVSPQKKCYGREEDIKQKLSDIRHNSAITLFQSVVGKLVSVLPIFDKLVKVAELVDKTVHIIQTASGEKKKELNKKFNSIFIGLSASFNKYFYVLRAKIEAAIIYRDLVSRRANLSSYDVKVLTNIYMLDITIIANKLDDLINVFTLLNVNNRLTSVNIETTLEEYKKAIDTLSSSIETAFTLLYANLDVDNTLITQLKQKLHTSTEFFLLNSQLRADDCNNIDFPLTFQIMLKTSEQLQFVFDTIDSSIQEKETINNQITQEEFEKIKEKNEVDVKKFLGCTPAQKLGVVQGFGTQCVSQGGSKRSKKSKRRKTYKRRK